MPSNPDAGLTVRDAARRYRVGQDKVRLWIKNGELAAVNTAASGKPRYVIPPDALTAFERLRAAASAGPRPARCKRPPAIVRRYPD